MAKTKKGPGWFSRLLNTIGRYFVGVVHQSKKVRWPGKKDLFRSTILVITFAGLFAVYLNLCNLVIIWMFRALGLNI